MEQMREHVARAIAPFLEGWREFDKMPVNRLQLREWARQAMCGFNDATQDDAYEAADALQPEIDRRVAEEKAKLLERLREPSETMIEAGVDRTQHFDLEPHLARGIWQAMLAQYEKDNSDG